MPNRSAKAQKESGMRIQISHAPFWIGGKGHSKYSARSLSNLVGSYLKVALQSDGKVYLVRASVIKTELGSTTTTAIAWQAHCERHEIRPSDIVTLPVNCAVVVEP